ncbi:hypothetical protein BGX38DRAFT_529752 [Terfezia claveryi]|nr:hypothetical protein BGX38DRAFT_529752 [Terfezia claveryi]
MSVVFLTASSQEAVTSLNHDGPIPSSTETPYTYDSGSESQSAPTGASNPGLLLGILAALIVFFALLCTWCCKRRLSKKTPANPPVASLPQYSCGNYTYQPPAPQPAVVHEQGPWPGYPVHYYNSTDAWTQPGVPGEGASGPRQLIPEYDGYVPQQSAPAPKKHGSKRLSIGSRFPIAPR